MKKVAAAKRAHHVKGLPYTFIVSLYCTLMIWSAFLSIDRRQYAASAAAAAPLSGAAHRAY